MRVLTEIEATAFLREYGLGDELAHLDPATCRTETSADVGRRYVWANTLTNHLITDPDTIACLDVKLWGVWPSCQNMDLFYAYRKSLGESRDLMEAHFHVFTAAEAKELRNILHLCLISLFDVAGASTTTQFRFYASHDEWLDVLWFDGADWVETMQWFWK